MFRSFSATSLAAAVLTLSPSVATAKVKVVTSIPDLAWAASEIGGSLVTSEAMLKGSENPHFVDAVPEFTRLAADADVVCIVGLELEIGYLPPVLTRSGNAKVQPGGSGYCEAGRSVHALDKPTAAVDRSMGDVHVAGNPHFFLSPKAMAEAGEEIAAALTRADPKHANDYQTGLRKYQGQLTALSTEIAAKLAPFLTAQKIVGNRPLIIEYHKEFTYFFAQYGILSFGSIEEKPGVPPSAGRLAEVANAAKAAGVRLAIGTDYNPAKTLQRFAELSGIKLALVPTMMQPQGKLKTYREVQLFIAQQLNDALAGPAPVGK